MQISKITIVFFIILIAVTSSCDLLSKKENKREEEEVKTETREVKKATSKVNYQIKTLQKKNTPCVNDECTRIKVGYPKFSTEVKHSKSINKTIEEKTASLISYFVPDSKDTDSPDKLMTSFIEGYKMYKATFPEAQTKWFVEINSKPSFRSSDFISVKFEIKSYTGGAHSSEEVVYTNISSKGRELKKLSHFFRDRQSIKRLAESKFRKQNNLSESASLNDAGYLFSNDKFALSDNFGFNQRGLVFFYNNYEISTASEGITEINIPLSELKDNFRF
ncbi:MAG: DUF4163 domain-containing protein [Cyclobacteriaceae bacterium]